MNYNDKTREELIDELITLHHSNNALREQYKQDISLLKLAEEGISKSEEKFRKAFMTSPDSVNLNRLSDGMYVSVNEGFSKILGYAGEETLGKTSLDLNIWADQEIRKNMVKELQEKGKVESFEADFLRKDGSIVNGLMSASLIDLDGVPHILNITKDITSRKQIEKELLHEQFLVNALMENLTDHVYFKDLENRFIRINKSHANSFGIDDPSKAIGKTDFDFFSNDHAQQAYDDELALIRTGNPISKEERETWPDRPDKWVSTIKMPLLDAKGNIIGTFGISRDITEQKNLENELHFKKLLLEAIIENVPDQIYYKDRNSKFVLCNTPVALLAGCTSEKDLIGKSDFDFYPLHLAQQYFKDEQDLMEKGQPLLNYEEQILSKKTNELLWNLSSKVPVKNTEGLVIGMAGINRDITDRKKAEEEIKLRNSQLQEMNAEKDKFFSILAHDLRGPLGAFISATQILTDEIQSMSIEDIREISISMKKSSSNIYNLLENLLEWSRIQRGTINFNPVNMFLLSKITDSMSLILEQAKKKNIAINYSIASDLEVHADVHMFETIIRNLVSNAIKFTNPGGEITISAARSTDNKIEIRIRDTGIGLSSELIGKLFKLNEQTSRIGTEGEPSSGLGLFLCKEFIEKHGGKINVESEEGKGSTFSFTI